MQNSFTIKSKSLDELYRIAEEEGIKVLSFNLPKNKAVTVNIGDDCYIGVDPAVFGRECEERIILAHEMGHIATGAFYTEDTDEEYRKKQELKAERWAMEHLVPKSALKKAIKNGCHSLESMAEHFCVTEEYMSKVLLYYLDN
jgi:Zn-dependent peptidase ImmA (M78 family)